MKKECIFCDLLSGKRKEHVNKLPFKILKESRNSVSFLSIDVPKKTGINILVIPRKHFELFEEVPDRILKDLMKHCKSIIKSLKKKYPGANLIMNDGWDANQRVPHVHFHIYPRKKNDGFYKPLSKVMKRTKDAGEFERTYKEVLKLLKD
jgi:histidine triad (HIT) family protein